MNETQMIKIVKEIGNDATLFSDFLAKLSGYIYLTSNSTDFKSEVHTDYENTEIITNFSYKTKRKKEAKE